MSEHDNLKAETVRMAVVHILLNCDSSLPHVNTIFQISSEIQCCLVGPLSCFIEQLLEQALNQRKQEN